MARKRVESLVHIESLVHKKYCSAFDQLYQVGNKQQDRQGTNKPSIFDTNNDFGYNRGSLLLFFLLQSMP